MIISIYNQKGGVGKTTTAHTLAAGLCKRGFSVLAVDLDGQANLTNICGIATDRNTAYDLLTGDTFEPIKTGSFDLIPGSGKLDGADGYINAPDLLLEALSRYKSAYDFIILDSPPALGMIGLNALAASDRVIIPVHADKLSAQGVEKLAAFIARIRTEYNPGLKIDGLLLTGYNGRAVIAREYREYFADRAQALQTRLYNATIREGVAVQEAQTVNESVFDYAPRAKVTADYNAFIDEFLTGCK